ncbi:MAG: hypothetical protein ABIF22_03035 [bacterium]
MKKKSGKWNGVSDVHQRAMKVIVKSGRSIHFYSLFGTTRCGRKGFTIENKQLVTCKSCKKLLRKYDKIVICPRHKTKYYKKNGCKKCFEEGFK